MALDFSHSLMVKNYDRSFFEQNVFHPQNVILCWKIYIFVGNVISRGRCHILAVVKTWHGDNIFSTRLRYWNFHMFLKNIESFGANDDFDDISFLKLDFIIFGLQISFSSVKKNFFGHFEKFLLRYYPKTYQPRIGG